MCNNHVVIIGSGLGGLSCGVILAKNGYQVTVLEKDAQAGGCLQCFCRNGAKFETGMHFIGSAAKGQTLSRLMDYLEMSNDVRLSQLNADGYDVVALGDRLFRFANGREGFIRQMTEYFPRQHDNLERYFTLVEQVANASSLHSLKYAETDTIVNTKYQMLAINDVIDDLITDPLLAKVLVGNLPLYAAERGKTPFSTHAFIMDFYNQSAFRIVGGSDAIAASMKATIERYGGQVLTRKKVTRIVCDDSKATGVEVNGGEEFVPAHFVISDAHPMRTLEMIDSRLIRPAFRNRINSIPQTVGGFSVYLEFKEHTMPYMNYNFYGYNSDTPWGCEHYDAASWPKGYLYMHFCHDDSPFAKTGVILSYMQMSEVEPWLGTAVGRRGEAYEAFKREKAARLLDSVERHCPGIRSCIKRYHTSTPLTYFDYTGTEGGSMYGIAKDVSLGAACRVPHKLRIPNVYQTGQNINSHGMLGVLVGTVVTCSEFLSAKTIFQQIIETEQ